VVLPKVIFIDKEDAVASAIALVFPDVRLFYYVFHINVCVLHKVKKVDQENDDQNLFINNWKAVIRAKTEQDFKEKWKLLMKDSIRNRLKTYLETEWLVAKKPFCHA
jgi:hypothetical protein